MTATDSANGSRVFTATYHDTPSGIKTSTLVLNVDNQNVTQNAIVTSRTATRRRRSAGTLRMIGMNTGRLPSGSSTSSKRMKAERKLWSMAARLCAMASKTGFPT